MIKNTALALIILNFIFSATDIQAKSENRNKRIYISNFTLQEGISKDMALYFRDSISARLLENYGDTYRILTDGDIRVMFKKAAELQAAGCNDRSCNIDLAEAINADEIIYGSLKLSGDTINAALYNLHIETGNEKRSPSIKSVVNISFPENEIKWISGEIALKLINPRYRIKRSPAIDVEIAMKPLEMDVLRPGKISELTFNAESSALHSSLQYYGAIAEKGDRLYADGDYADAAENYLKILNLINERMGSESQYKLRSFSEDINKRVASALIMKYKSDIEDTDRGISSSRPDLDDLQDAFENYSKIEKNMVSEAMYESAIIEVKKITGERRDKVLSSIISIHEQEADNSFNRLDFNRALKLYVKCKKKASAFHDEKIKENTYYRIQKKIVATISTGRNYLRNRFYSLIEQAEFYNIISENGKAVDKMDEVKEEITSGMIKFSDLFLIDTYNDTAIKIKNAKIITPQTREFVFMVSSDPTKDYKRWKEDLKEVGRGCCVLGVFGLIIISALGSE